MKELLIDTCLNDVTIVLYENKSVKTIEKVEGQKNNSQYILPTIKKVLGEDKPGSIICVNGPGSFTGVRLGATVAKTLAYTLNIPIKTISTLEAMAVSLEASPKVVGIKDSRGYFIGIFDDEINLIGEYKYVENDVFTEFNEKHPVSINVPYNYDKIREFIEKRESVNPHSVKPFYIKKISVEK